MRSIIRHFIRYPVWVKVILISIVVFGSASLFNMKSSFFAPIDPRTISIQVAYPGSSPQEIEEGIILKIEDNLKGIQGIERTTSVSRENSGTITVEVQKGEDGEEVLQDVKNAVDQISSFPTGMEPPIIYKLPIEDFAVSFALTGDLPLLSLKHIAKKVERDLLAIDGISLVTISGYPEEEIEVRVREKTLRSLGITIEDVGKAINDARVELTGGRLKGLDIQYIVRAKNKAYVADDLKQVVIKADKNGDVIYLGDISDIRDTWEDNPARTFFNGQPSVVIEIRKTVNEDILFISDTISDYMATFNAENDSVKAHLVRDGSIVLKQRISLLSKNGVTGFLLVLGLLALFLNIRLAFWVALSIPISFLGMFLLGYNITSMTINVISLFGMIVVIGILVDDGIVIGENIFQQYERGKTAEDAAIDGVMEVLPSVFAAILTTIIAFTPFFFLDGRIADVMNNMAIVVILTLLVSLLEGGLILPSHLAHSKALQSKHKRSGLRVKTDRVMKGIRQRFYAPLLRFAIANQLLTFTVPIVMFVLTIGAVRGGYITSTFFPFVDSDDITVNLTMPSGINEDITLNTLTTIERAIWQVNEEFKAQRKDGLDVIETVVKEISSSSDKGSLKIALLDGERRNMESFKVGQAIREQVGTLSQAESLEIGGRGFFGRAVSISLLSNNLDELRGAKQALKDALNSYDKVRDVIDNDQLGMPEVLVTLTPQAYQLGLTDRAVMRQIRNNLFGYEVQRTQRGTDEVKIWVRYPEGDRRSLGQLEEMRIRTPDGRLLPLSALAEINVTRSSMVINHLDGLREIKVEANQDDAKDPLPPILDHILTTYMPSILAQYPSVSYSLEGQKRQTDKTANSAKLVMPLTITLMFFVVVLGYRSFSQALLTFLLVPFGYIGMAWGHFIHGLSINLLSIFGFIALIGIIVNDSIVLTNTFNRLISKGIPFRKAIYRAGLSRFRPIILTSITTIAGLGPLILEKSRQAQFLIPMAVAVAYGLLFATFIILVVLPAGLVVLNYVRRLLVYVRKGYMPDAESVEPAIKELKYNA